MSAATAADEFAAYVSGPKGGMRLPHPEDRIPSRSSSRSGSGSSSASSLSSPSKSRRQQSSQPKQQQQGHQVRPSLPDRYRHSFNDANTGPKGVLADARAYERAWQEARQKSSSALNVSTIVNGGNRNSGPWPFTRAGSRNPSRRRIKANSYEDDVDSKTNRESGGDDDKGGGEEEEEEDDFMHRWRHDRLNQLRNTSTTIITNTSAPTTTTTTKSGRRSIPSLRRYGSVESVDAIGYLDAIERVGRDTIVVVYIYDDQSEISSQIDLSLKSLARKHINTRFIRLSFQEAEMDVVAVPAFLAYRAGDLFVNLTAVVDLLPDSAISFDHDHDDDDSDVGGGIFGIDVCSLETFLQSHRIL